MKIDPNFSKKPWKKMLCKCCNKTLNPEKAEWLELNCMTGIFQDGGIVEEESQGWFSFGNACAKKVLENGGRI